ncbi:helix-turn-helix domain-containing protein [Streptomyces sp. NPDC001984]|uniref:helix-turn-helix domain-containing protein n=1 Tax=Streptomyces sp. NPDC002619 TaxID=3364655 RepID=UPI00369535FC
MSVGTRRILVAHLTDRGMNPQEIADELDVSRETVRRDLHNPPPTQAPEPAADVPPAEDELRLPASPQLGQDLRLITASYKRPAEDVAAELLHAHAETIRARVHARLAATGQGA